MIFLEWTFWTQNFDFLNLTPLTILGKFNFRGVSWGSFGGPAPGVTEGAQKKKMEGKDERKEKKNERKVKRRKERRGQKGKR